MVDVGLHITVDFIFVVVLIVIVFSLLLLLVVLVSNFEKVLVVVAVGLHITVDGRHWAQIRLSQLAQHSDHSAN